MNRPQQRVRQPVARSRRLELIAGGFTLAAAIPLSGWLRWLLIALAGALLWHGTRGDTSLSRSRAHEHTPRPRYRPEEVADQGLGREPVTPSHG